MSYGPQQEAQMRRGINGAGVERLEDGRIYGVNLGADYTAEHEMGIKDLSRYFALDATAAPGLPRRKANAVPTGVTLLPVAHERQKYKVDPIKGESYVVAYTRYGGVRMEELNFTSYTEAEIVGAWSEGDFAVHFKPEHKQDAQDLYDAIQAEDIAFLFGNVGNNPFARAGLCLVIASRLPAAIVESLEAIATDRDALEAAARATGIQDDIDYVNAAARGNRSFPLPKGYYALSPRWANDEKTEVKFWLNPADQQNNKSGWYTPEELLLWVKDEGPVMGKRVKV
jgi:hypothetical protein